MGREYVIEKIREFNRYYMSVLSLLDKSYLHSDYSVTEARILYELLENEPRTANLLSQKLQIDKSYLSRILHKFENKGMIDRKPSSEDTRKYELRLTKKGMDAAYALIALSNEKIGNILQALSDKDCEAICQSMDTITAILKKEEF